ncbi:hypothetical protein [Kitasatospora sp. NPDC088346]|uniref:hypothetical protein n=1 Tax=Kitasatospora sp. NPDC088346 TaxID=3364073 RepID=UPI0038048D97
MSTTRHLINRQRRLAVAPARVRPASATGSATAPESAAAGESLAAPEPAAEAPRARTARPRARPRRTTVLLGAAAVLLGAFAGRAALAAADLRADSASHNSALVDPARTSEVKGTVAEAVNALFSYSYADPGRTDRAAQRLLTGRAVDQHATLLAQVRAQAAAKKLVLTTTVTDSGVQTLDGDRARVIVFADQRNTSTAEGAKDAATYAAAMFAVDAVRRDGGWRIENIDTFGR